MSDGFSLGKSCKKMMFAMGLKRSKQTELCRYQKTAMISKADFFSLSHLFQTLEGLDSTIVKTELALWREKYIDVATVMDEFVDLRGRTVLLRDEVNFEIISLLCSSTFLFSKNSSNDCLFSVFFNLF